MLFDVLLDVLRPKTDAMVLAQVVIVVALIGLGVWRTWHLPEVRFLVLGLGVFLLGLMMLRASH